MKKQQVFFVSCLACLALLLLAASPLPQSLNPDPPGEVVKLIFIHHSCGENWLTDDYGNLGRELGENNYFVSDTNYGWGPDSIGDRTDIPNWIEWFRSSETPAYMDALFNESGQNSYYTRSLSDPGGENRVIMFKSCFPNSELDGSPNDPPGTYEDLTVSGAKYTYNEILKFFATRPDKLFIVITAPPVSDSTYARNARAFNTWLVEDWLDENNYTLPNVAVFDFYNVLTDRNAHHRYEDGQIEHIVKSSNTLAYPSGDDHPSEQGSRKATEEFIPLLNIYYHRWQETAPEAAAVESSAGEAAQVESQPQESVAALASLIDDFEGDSPAGTNGWEANYDAATSTSISCAIDSGKVNSGSGSLAIDFDVEANSWAICALYYDSAQDWSAAQGLNFYLRAQEAGLVFDVDLYAGSYENLETYLYTIEAPPDSADGWMPFSLNWSDFHRASWEENANEPFAKPDKLLGLAFGMSTYPDTPNTGKIWVDDISLLGGESAGAASEDEFEQESTRRRFSLPCGSAFALPAVVLALGLIRKKQQHE